MRIPGCGQVRAVWVALGTGLTFKICEGCSDSLLSPSCTRTSEGILRPREALIRIQQYAIVLELDAVALQKSRRT